MRFIFIFIVLLFLNACVTQVTSIKDDQSKVLAEESGFVLLGVESNINLNKIYITGPQNIKLTSKDIKKGTNYLFVDLKAGTYAFDKVSLDDYWYLSLSDDERPGLWSFTIKPGEINYVGHLELVNRGGWYTYAAAELVNRSSESLEFLEKKYPKILKKTNIVYGGPGTDAFFDFIVKTKRAVK